MKGGMYLGGDDNGFWSGEVSANGGFGTLNNGRKTRNAGAGAKVNYTQYTNGPIDFTVGAGVDAGYGWSYRNGDVKKIGFDTWPSLGMVTIEGEDIPYIHYNPYYYAASKTPKTDKRGGFYITPSASAEIGFNDNFGSRTSLYGSVGTDVMSKDKFAKVGAKWETPLGGIIEDYMDATLSIGADYTFNNQNHTKNIVDQKGWTVGVGFNVCF